MGSLMSNSRASMLILIIIVNALMIMTTTTTMNMIMIMIMIMVLISRNVVIRWSWSSGPHETLFAQLVCMLHKCGSRLGLALKW